MATPLDAKSAGLIFDIIPILHVRALMNYRKPIIYKGLESSCSITYVSITNHNKLLSILSPSSSPKNVFGSFHCAGVP